MHAITILHRILSTSFPEIHAKRLASLLAAVEAVVTGSRLTLSDMGRGLTGRSPSSTTSNASTACSATTSLHTEIPKLYEALVRQCLDGISMPLIVIDWSDLTPDRQWQLLRASVAVEGRSMTLYEQVHPQSRATSPRVHQAFLTQLATMLPTGCVPILITDAGFRGAWFRLVNRMGWYWIGRIRNRDMVSPAECRYVGWLQNTLSACHGQGEVTRSVQLCAQSSGAMPSGADQAHQTRSPQEEQLGKRYIQAVA